MNIFHAKGLREKAWVGSLVTTMSSVRAERLHNPFWGAKRVNFGVSEVILINFPEYSEYKECKVR